MQGISSKAAGGTENKKKYNGIEFTEELDLDMYDAFYRNLDPQIGRWWQIDPKLEEGQESMSPYASMFDNPMKYNDPLGDCPLCFVIEAAEAIEAALTTESVIAGAGAVGGVAVITHPKETRSFTRKVIEANAEQILSTGYSSQPLGLTSVPVAIRKPEVVTTLLSNKKGQQQVQKQEQHGGGKNAPHANQNARESALEKYENAKNSLMS